MLTESQMGPLYRTMGSRLSITCNVRGFSSPNATKDFEFRFLPPSVPPTYHNIISTSTKNFGYAIYSRRVQTGDIKLTHASPNSVVFEIQRLQKADEGEFQCLVVNSEHVYKGIYSDTTLVKGITLLCSILIIRVCNVVRLGKTLNIFLLFCVPRCPHSDRQLPQCFFSSLGRAELQRGRCSHSVLPGLQQHLAAHSSVSRLVSSQKWRGHLPAHRLSQQGLHAHGGQWVRGTPPRRPDKDG